jgi:bifunctional ADP-heptose synthase (sugar kinase/adenylyltransferase)
LEDQLARHVLAAAQKVDAMIVLDQVDASGTGVITSGVLKAIAEVGRQHPGMPVLADSRRGLRGFPPVIYKMNAAELAAFSGGGTVAGVDQVLALAREVAKENQRAVFVTLSDQGIAGAAPNGDCCHVKTLPVKGEIDIVGAGDSVSANLTAALAAGGSLAESMEIANAAASVVIHKLGTTGTASPDEIVACWQEAGVWRAG